MDVGEGEGEGSTRKQEEKRGQIGTSVPIWYHEAEEEEIRSKAAQNSIIVERKRASWAHAVPFSAARVVRHGYVYRSQRTRSNL